MLAFREFFDQPGDGSLPADLIAQLNRQNFSEKPLDHPVYRKKCGMTQRNLLGGKLTVLSPPNDSGSSRRRCAKDVLGGEPIITYCRIGERSAHTWFVLHELLGLPDVKNYDGSWAEWGNLIGVPIEKG